MSFVTCEIGDEPASARLRAPVVPPGAVLSLRRLLGQDAWDAVRRRAYAVAGRSCRVCHGTGEAWPVAASPEWEFDLSTEAETGYGTQRLVDVVALCPGCLEARNDLLSYALGFCDAPSRSAVARLVGLYGLGEEEVAEAVEAAAIESAKLCDVPWVLDLSWLAEAGPFESVPELEDRTARVLVDGVVMGGL